MSEDMINKNSVKGLDLDRIYDRVVISTNIRLLSQMHIGTSYITDYYSPYSGILLTSMGDPDNLVPFIPNTSIKGILRSEAERIAKAFSDKEPSKNYICKKYPERYCQVDNGEEPCFICRIFGGNGLGAHIILSDAFLTDDSIKQASIKLKPGISIERDKQVTHENSLFFNETLQPGVEFKLNIIINNIFKEKKPEEFEIMRILFKMIKMEILSIGGMRSTGLGKFTFVNSSVRHLTNKEDFLLPEKVEAVDISQYFDI